MDEFLPLKIAKNTCAFVKKALSFGPTNYGLNALDEIVSAYIGTMRAEGDILTDYARTYYPKEKAADGRNLKLTFYMFPQIEKECKKVKTGCCGEFSVVAFQHLRNVYSSGDELSPLEMVRARGHWVVVLNRKKDTNLLNPKTWNEDAVVCDTWRNEAKSITYYLGSHGDFKPLESMRLPDKPDDFLVVPAGWSGW